MPLLSSSSSRATEPKRRMSHAPRSVRNPKMRNRCRRTSAREASAELAMTPLIAVPSAARKPHSRRGEGLARSTGGMLTAPVPASEGDPKASAPRQRRPATPAPAPRLPACPRSAGHRSLPRFAGRRATAARAPRLRRPYLLSQRDARTQRRPPNVWSGFRPGRTALHPRRRTPRSRRVEVA